MMLNKITHHIYLQILYMTFSYKLYHLILLKEKKKYFRFKIQSSSPKVRFIIYGLKMEKNEKNVPKTGSVLVL